MGAQVWDSLIQNATVFDGSGNMPAVMDVAVKDGKIAAKGKQLPAGCASEVVNAKGLWLMPGLLDIHTHLDLEVELDPGMPEVVRHGTTTVLIGNCSLGTAFGKEIEGDQNPIVDCFSRVENIPKSVLSQVVEKITWDTTAGYMKHLEDRALGPNVGVFLPHSMLRVEVMGLQDSISRKPTKAELDEMERLVEESIDQGYLGLSTDGLPFHYLANSPNTDKRIPTQFAPFSEMKRLVKVLRNRGRVWQTTPILSNKLLAFVYFSLTSGRLFGKTLKTTALGVMEFPTMPIAAKMFLGFSRLMNSWLFKGNMHFQALGTNFRMWSDGINSPAYEE